MDKMADSHRRKIKCCVSSCGNTSSDETLSFFKLPDDVERRREWLELVGRTDLLLRDNMKPKSHLVCSIHFERSQITEVTKRQIKRKAVPSKFLPGLNGLISENNIIVTTNTASEATCGASAAENDIPAEKQDEIERLPQERLQGKRYDAAYKMFTLTFHYSSPDAYQCLQKILKLPRKRTLNRFKINILPKLDDRALYTLQFKMKYLPDSARYCTICIDEMPLKRNLYYDISADEVIGIQNINDTASPEFASNAYVVMLQGIFFNWKHPLAYAVLAGTRNLYELDFWLHEILSKLFELKMKVKAIISDQDSNFDNFAKEVKGVSVGKPYFMYDNNKIYYMFDVPHLIKCICNNLMTSDFYHDGNKISWDFIQQLYDDQKGKTNKLIPKITDTHMIQNNMEKMSVKYAAQILSRSVSVALHTYIDLQVIPEQARTTANCIGVINNLFDVLNSCKIKCDNKYRSAYRMTKVQEKAIREAQDMFATIATWTNDKSLIKSLVNIQLSIKTIMFLYEELIEDGFTYMLTRRLNQDNLRKFFSGIRKQCGCTEPTPIQFRRSYSKLFVCNLLEICPEARARSSKLDIYDLLEKAEDVMKSRFPVGPVRATSAVGLDGDTDYRMDLPQQNTLIYVSGYLLYKCFIQGKCPHIAQVLKQARLLDESLFNNYSTYNTTSGFYGQLKLPRKPFITYVNKLETAFIENYEKFIHSNPGSQLFEILNSISPPMHCACYPHTYVVKLFIRLRVYTTLRFNNRSLESCQNQKYVKTVLLN